MPDRDWPLLFELLRRYVGLTVEQIEGMTPAKLAAVVDAAVAMRAAPFGGLATALEDAAGQRPSAPVTPRAPEGHTWTELEATILAELHGAAFTLEALARHLGLPVPTVRDRLLRDKPLRRSGVVANRRGLGYYRTDAPPDLDAE